MVLESAENGELKIEKTVEYKVREGGSLYSVSFDGDRVVTLKKISPTRGDGELSEYEVKVPKRVWDVILTL